MNFDVELYRNNDTYFSFSNKVCSPVYMSDEPSTILGKIEFDGHVIGKFRLYEFDNDNDFYYKCDEISADCESIASTICGKKGNVLKKYLPNISIIDTIMILDKIEIKKEFRGLGIGSDVLKNMLKMINYQFDCGKVIFLCASAFELAEQFGQNSDEHKNWTKRLICFYKKLGFKVISENIMALYKQS